MKLRIRGETIRLRLKRSEVDAIASGESLSEDTRFPGATFTCRLEIADDGQFAAALCNNTISIRLPADAVARWASSDEVSLFAEQNTGGPNALSLLVEKDFQCLAPGHHRPGEDDEDTYPHPDAGTGAGC